jgi:hypothetical protein
LIESGSAPRNRVAEDRAQPGSLWISSKNAAIFDDILLMFLLQEDSFLRNCIRSGVTFDRHRRLRRNVIQRTERRSP